MAELLNISRDSAYRRLREETGLTLDEVRILCDRYNVSIDSLMERDSGRVSFEPRAQYGPGLSLKSWLEAIHGHLRTIGTKPDGQMVWHSKELPIFHYFRFPQLAAFKLYWWMNLSNGDFSIEKYNERNIGVDLISLAERTWNVYSRLSSTEIISRELMNTTLRQIEYAHESGFLSQSQAVKLCQDCSDLVQQLERQTRLGVKQDNDASKGGKFDVYVNDLMIGDNTILFKSGDEKLAFVTYNNFNIMSTNHDSFCKQTEHFMNAMIRSGMLISRVAERERIKFFKGIQVQIENTLASLMEN
jgi:hypothetical protein